MATFIPIKNFVGYFVLPTAMLLTACGGGGNTSSADSGKQLPEFLQRQGGDGAFSETPDPTGCVADEYEQNDTAATAYTLGGDASLALNFCDDSDDYFRIAMTGGDTITLETVSLEAATDTIITVLDSAGNELDSDDDSGDGLASKLSYTAPGGGADIVIWVHQFDAAVIGENTGYALNASIGAAGSGLPDFQFGTSYIATPTDERTFEFEIIVENIGTAAASADVGFYLSQDQVIDLGDTFVDFTSTDIIAAGDNATISGVVQWPLDISGEYTFGLFVDDLDTVVEADESNNTTYFAPAYLGAGDENCLDDFAEQDDSFGAARTFSLPLNRSYRSCTDSEDWLKFDTTSGSVYTIATSRLSENSDTLLELYDATGTLIAENNNAGGLNSAINYTATTNGELYLRMRQNEFERGRGRGFFININENDTRPNLIAFVSLPGGPLTANTTGTVSLTIINTGLSDAPASKVSFSGFESQIGSLNRDGQNFLGLLQLDVPTVSAQSFVEVNGTFTIPNFNGSLEFTAAADRDNEVDEVDDDAEGPNYNQGNFVLREIVGGTKSQSLPAPVDTPPNASTGQLSAASHATTQ